MELPKILLNTAVLPRNLLDITGYEERTPVLNMIQFFMLYILISFKGRVNPGLLIFQKL